MVKVHRRMGIPNIFVMWCEQQVMSLPQKKISLLLDVNF